MLRSNSVTAGSETTLDGLTHVDDASRLMKKGITKVGYEDSTNGTTLS